MNNKKFNKKFCKRLRIAKKVACSIYAGPNRNLCIVFGCIFANLDWGQNVTFDDGGKYEDISTSWVEDCAKSAADIARVFDESIRALGEKP